MAERRSPAAVRPRLIAALCAAGFLAFFAAYYPGWMSFDSVMQYTDARNGMFRNWHPVLMAWWWEKLNFIHNGPQLMLAENLALYWAGWGLFANALSQRFGRLGLLVLVGGLWPGLLLTLGWIWKDVLFATLMFCAFGIIAATAYGSGRFHWWQRAAIVVFAVFGFGVKTNGLTVLPFLFGYWVYVEGWWRGRPIAGAFAVAVLVVGAAGAAILMVPAARIIDQHPTQYMMGHDLLGIGVQTGEMLLPAYLTADLSPDPAEIDKLYNPSGFGRVFVTADRQYKLASPEQFADLSTRWLKAVSTHPVQYLAHRWRVFMALMSIGKKRGYPGVAPVTNPVVDTIWHGIRGQEWLFLPWVYAVLFLLSAALLLTIERHRALCIGLGGGAVAFVAPHFFVAPAWDFRYLYFACLVAVLFAIMALLEVMTRKWLWNEAPSAP